MAIDTAAKRKSTVNVGLHFMRMGVIPDDNNLAAAERLHTQGLYTGIAADGPSGSAINILFARMDGTFIDTAGGFQ